MCVLRRSSRRQWLVNLLTQRLRQILRALTEFRDRPADVTPDLRQALGPKNQKGNKDDDQNMKGLNSKRHVKFSFLCQQDFGSLVEILLKLSQDCRAEKTSEVFSNRLLGCRDPNTHGAKTTIAPSEIRHRH